MSAPIQATVHAPTAPLWQRVMSYGIGWLFIAAGLVALNSFPFANALLGIGAWTLLIAPFFLRRRNAKSARITVLPGRVVIRAPRSFPRTVPTRALRGASVSRAGERFVLWLQEKSSDAPISIELTSEPALKEIRKALGIRRYGFGDILLPSNRWVELVDRAYRIAALGALSYWGLTSAVYAHASSAVLALLLTIVSAAFSMLRFTVWVPSTRVANQSTVDTDDAPRIEQLRRRGESVADWLARIDAIAATHSQTGYRGAQIPMDDLWSAMESHETARDIRAAAGRLLMRVSPENSADRIAAALESIHDDTERAHLRAALDSDPEVAARELESLDEKISSRRV